MQAHLRKYFIIIGVDYMTKWEEVAPTTSVKTKEVAKFVSKIWYPLKIILDRGPSFRGDLVGELMEKLGNASCHSTSYYPQFNGLVEKIKKPKYWD